MNTKSIYQHSTLTSQNMVLRAGWIKLIHSRPSEFNVIVRGIFENRQIYRLVALLSTSILIKSRLLNRHRCARYGIHSRLDEYRFNRICIIQIIFLKLHVRYSNRILKQISKSYSLFIFIIAKLTRGRILILIHIRYS